MLTSHLSIRIVTTLARGDEPYHWKLNECRRVIIQLPLIETSWQSSRIFLWSPKAKYHVLGRCWCMLLKQRQFAKCVASSSITAGILSEIGLGDHKRYKDTQIYGVLGARHVDDDDDVRSWTLCWPISKAMHLHLHLEDQRPLESIIMLKMFSITYNTLNYKIILLEEIKKYLICCTNKAS